MKTLTKWRLLISFKKTIFASIFVAFGFFSSYVGPTLFIERYKYIPSIVVLFTTITTIMIIFVLSYIYFFIKSNKESVVDFIHNKMYKIRLNKKFETEAILGSGKLFKRYWLLENIIQEIQEEESEA